MESEELTISGSLSESSLPELLASISRSKETGILNFHDAGRWKAIYFKEGRIIYAMSNAQDDRLGEFLLKSGKITVRQFLEASKLIQPDKKLGAVLVEQGIISRLTISSSRSIATPRRSSTACSSGRAASTSSSSRISPPTGRWCSISTPRTSSSRASAS